jgi:hypothetical protein
MQHPYSLLFTDSSFGVVHEYGIVLYTRRAAPASEQEDWVEMPIGTTGMREVSGIGKAGT